MTDWFRSWHGAPTDPKWLGIARKAGVAPAFVVAVAWALMDRASQARERGSITGYDADGLACFFGCEPEQVDMIVAAMVEKGMIDADRFSSWESRQPKREDDAAERTRAWRERKRAERDASVTQGDNQVTISDAAVTHGDAPESDTDTDTEKISGANAPSSPEPEKSAPDAVVGLPTVSDGDLPIFEADIVEWSSAFPAVDVRQQLAAMRQWLLANPSRRKTKRGMRKFVVSWLDRRQNSSGALPQPRANSPPAPRNIAERMALRLKEINGNDQSPDAGPGRVDTSHERGQDSRFGDAKLVTLSSGDFSRR